MDKLLNMLDPPHPADIHITGEDLEIEAFPPIWNNAAMAGMGSIKGKDSICAEFSKLTQKRQPTSYTPSIWRFRTSKNCPITGRKGIIILSKKFNITDCSNWIGITLISIPNKMFSNVIMTRMTSTIDKLLRQSGFRKGRGTT